MGTTHAPTRRDLIAGGAAALTAAGLGATARLAAADGAVGAASATPVVTELDIPEVPGPEVAHHDCDVLVVGGGYAAYMAAVTAKAAGKDVLLVDKGKPGYSGLSAYAHEACFFSEELGDSFDDLIYMARYSNEYLCNLDWVRTWATESRAVYDAYEEAGFLASYPTGEQDGAWVDAKFEHDRLVEYHEAHADQDRHARYTQALEERGIPYLQHTMLIDVIEDAGRVVGAVGLHVKSGTPVTFSAKAVVLCTGTGSYKPAGFPTSCCTFDGEYIGYMHGLPITGHEFEDAHMSPTYAPGNTLGCNAWPYLEAYWATRPSTNGGTPEAAPAKQAGTASSMILPWINSVYGITPSEKTRGSAAKENPDHPDDPRTTGAMSACLKGDVFGAAAGMSSHYDSGVFCGLDDREGRTGLPGLWVAGDGTNGSMTGGTTKGIPGGATSNLAGVQGKLAALSACAYVDGVDEVPLPAEAVDAVVAELQAPLAVERGYAPDWVLQKLCALMTDPWVLMAKDEASLNAALSQLEVFKDRYLPRLRATCGHDLRLCAELKHKVLVAEAKMRASLARRESRGYHYRTDFPYRDDEFLCLFVERRGDDGQMLVERVEVPEEWKGDLAAPYGERYASWRYPGEEELLGLDPLPDFA